MLYPARWKKIIVDQSKVLTNRLYRLFRFFGPPGIVLFYWRAITSSGYVDSFIIIFHEVKGVKISASCRTDIFCLYSVIKYMNNSGRLYDNTLPKDYVNIIVKIIICIYTDRIRRLKTMSKFPVRNRLYYAWTRQK